MAKSFLDRTLWPEFEQAQALLHEHFEAVTRRIIAQAIGESGDDADVREVRSLEE